MAFSARNDSFFMQLHTFPGDQRRCYHQFIGKFDSLANCNAGGAASCVSCKSPAPGLNLSIKSCFDDSLRARDQKARASAPRLVRDSEIFIHNEHRKMANSAIDTRGACQSGIPLDIADNSSPEKITVAVDVDEVLGNFVSALNKFIADRYSSNHSVSEYYVYEFFKIWNCSRQEANIRVHEFFESPYFKKGIHPIPGAQSALRRLSRFCNLSVVTSRQNVIQDHTLEWLEQYYLGLFQDIHFGNHFALDGESRPKSEICRLIGAKVLIDDNPRYAIECAQAGINVLLFDYENSYPWCKVESIEKHPLVTKVNTWEEVEQRITAWNLSSSIP